MIKKYALKSIYVLLLSFSLSIQAQFTKRHLLPKDGDKLYKSITKYLDDNAKSDSCLWDFSNVAQNKIYKVSLATKGDTLLTSEGNSIYYRQTKGDSLYILGFENTSSKFSYLLPELELKYPIVFGDSISCYFSAIGEYSGQYEMDLMGKKQIVVNARGILITPDKDTLLNVIQVRTLKLMAQTTGKIDWDNLHKYFDPSIISFRVQEDTAIIKSENIKWFHSGHRYPVFESVRNSVIKGEKEKDFFSSSYYYSPLEQEDLKYDPDNQEILDEIKEISEKERESKWIAYYNRSINNMNGPISKTKGGGSNYINEKNTFSEDAINSKFDSQSFVLTAFYPSPVKDFLHLEYSIPESSSVEFAIMNMSGKTLYRKNEYKTSGANKTLIDMRSILDGSYIIRLSLQGNSLNEIIVLKK